MIPVNPDWREGNPESISAADVVRKLHGFPVTVLNARATKQLMSGGPVGAPDISDQLLAAGLAVLFLELALSNLFHHLKTRHHDARGV